MTNYGPLFPMYRGDNVYKNITENMASELIDHIRNASQSIEFYDTENYINSIVEFTKATVRISRLWKRY